MAAYYNEIDPAAVHVLRHLIAEGVIAPGEVDDRSIKEVSADDVRGFTQCHFFAGAGLWSVAARMAGWPDSRPIWTGSCPCQPFSAAGKGKGTDDPRHLWPDFHRLIRAARDAGHGPAVVVGEQVAGKAGYDWFDGVRADLAGEGFSARTVDFPACAVDAPHQRNRLYWCAVVDAKGERRGKGRALAEFHGGWPTPSGADVSGVLGNGIVQGLERQSGHGDGNRRPQPDRPVAEADVGECELSSDAALPLVQGQPWRPQQDVGAIEPKQQASRRDDADRSHLQRNGTYWSDAIWIDCHDGKARRAQPDIRFLVDGLPGRIDLWRLGGNAIVPQAAAEVLGALMDVAPWMSLYE